MKRLWFFTLSFASSGNDLRSLESFFKVCSLLLSSALQYSKETAGTVYYQKPTQTAGKESLLISVHHVVFAASSCSKAFNCATKAITSTFSMRSCRKMPFSMHSKVFLMRTQVDEILAILYWEAALPEK